MIESLNSRLTYIEENLGTLTREEYRYVGSISITTSDYATGYQNVLFDRIFLEPPTVSAVYTSNPSGLFYNLRVSNITTSGCSIITEFKAASSRTCTIQYTAIGYVQKKY